MTVANDTLSFSANISHDQVSQNRKKDTRLKDTEKSNILMFLKYLECRVLTKNMELLRALVEDYYVEKEVFLEDFIRLGANLIVVLPLDHPDGTCRDRAELLLESNTCLEEQQATTFFQYLTKQLITRNGLLLENIYQEFQSQKEITLQAFIKRKDQVISFIPESLHTCSICTCVTQDKTITPPPTVGYRQQQMTGISRVTPQNSLTKASNSTGRKRRRRLSSVGSTSIEAIEDQIEDLNKQDSQVPIAVGPRINQKNSSRRGGEEEEYPTLKKVPPPVPQHNSRRLEPSQGSASRPNHTTSTTTSSSCSSHSSSNGTSGPISGIQIHTAPTRTTTTTITPPSTITPTTATRDLSVVPFQNGDDLPDDMYEWIPQMLAYLRSLRPWEAFISKKLLPFEEDPSIHSMLKTFWQVHGEAVWERYFWYKVPEIERKQRDFRQRHAFAALRDIVCMIYERLGVEKLVSLDDTHHEGWWYRTAIVDLFSLCKCYGKKACFDYIRTQYAKRIPELKYKLSLNRATQTFYKTEHGRSRAVWMNERIVLPILKHMDQYKHQRRVASSNCKSMDISPNQAKSTKSSIVVVETETRYDNICSIYRSSDDDEEDEEDEDEDEEEEEPEYEPSEEEEDDDEEGYDTEEFESEEEIEAEKTSDKEAECLYI